MLPELPYNDGEGGYEWMPRLKDGWYPVASWGSEGWNLGNWPFVCIAHYDGETFGVGTYVEGDIKAEEFPTREERDRHTDEIAIFYWKNYEIESAPKSMRDDDRLGPYRPT
ncbi:hypothetical protein ACFWP5_08720 [Streptomyces sp. NPDC058469]|uniref:hypothetical protein n=1 Tax=Streptomyces sp. NPDC058469 TaxID=3346514 RepID=UPI003653274F